jgi:hypothetical protein
MRDVNVAQYAPGYFYRTGAVTYTNGRIPEPEEVTDRQERAEQVLNFLIWRYCFYSKCDPQTTIRILDAYARSSELFPLPEELSYAQAVLDGASV